MAVENPHQTPPTEVYKCTEPDCTATFPDRIGLTIHKGAHTKAKNKQARQERDDQVKRLNWEIEELRRRNEELARDRTSSQQTGSPSVVTPEHEAVTTEPSVKTRGEQTPVGLGTFRVDRIDPAKPLPLRQPSTAPPGTRTPGDRQSDPANARRSSQRISEEETFISDDQTSISDDQPPHQRTSTGHQRSPVSMVQLSAEDMKQSIVDAVLAAMEARERVATVGNDGGSLGRTINETTVEYSVPDKDLVEKKVKFQPRIFIAQ